MVYLIQKISETEKFLRWRIKVQPNNYDAHLKLGLFLSKNEDRHDEAVVEFESAIVVDQQKIDAYYQLYLLQKRRGKVEEFEKALALLLEIFPDDVLVCIWKAISLDGYDDIKAEEFFIKAISLSPRLAFAHEKYGTFLLSRGRLLEAEKEFFTSLECDTMSVSSYRNLVHVLNNRKKYSEAEKFSRNFVKLDSTSPFAYHGLAHALMMLEKHDEAEKMYRVALSKKPNYAELFFDFGTFLCEKRLNFIEAETLYHKAIELNPEYLYAYNNLGILLNKLKRYAEAEAAFYEAIKLDPKDGAIYDNLGNLLSDSLRYEEAEGAYHKAIELNPVSESTYYNLGLLLGEQKKYKEAEASYRKAIEINPAYVNSYNNLGLLLNAQNRHVEAEMIYRNLVELEEKNNNAKYLLAKTLRKLNREDEAIEVLLAMSSVEAEYYLGYLELGSIQKTKGNSAETHRYLDLARPLIVKDDQYWYNLTCVESILGNADLAFDNLRKAAIESSFNHIWSWEDPDLQWIRDDPRFVEIVGPKPGE
jgi:tetratricopeptide (TPR) repeat protein